MEPLNLQTLRQYQLLFAVYLRSNVLDSKFASVTKPLVSRRADATVRYPERFQGHYNLGRSPRTPKPYEVEGRSIVVSFVFCVPARCGNPSRHRRTRRFQTSNTSEEGTGKKGQSLRKR